MPVTDFLVAIKDALDMFQAAIVGLVVELFSSVGVDIHPVFIQLVFIGFLLVCFWKWAKSLPKLILILLILAFVAFVIGFFSNL